jgi:CRP-like cAMP-binding protein
MDLDQLVTKLQETFLFRGIHGSDVADLTKHIRVESYDDGQEVFQEGSTGQQLYLVLEGSVDICKRSPAGTEQKLANLPVDSVFGEIGFVSGDPRNASACARGATRLAALNWDSFEDQLKQGKPAASHLLLKISRVLSSRVSIMGDELVKLADEIPDQPARKAEIAELRRKLLTNWDF